MSIVVVDVVLWVSVVVVVQLWPLGFVGGVLADDFGLFLFGDHGACSFLQSNCPATRHRAERLPQWRHDPEAEYAGDGSYIIIWRGDCQEKSSRFFVFLHEFWPLHYCNLTKGMLKSFFV